jgi:Ca2+-binding RTX toxin-like protein
MASGLIITGTPGSDNLLGTPDDDIFNSEGADVMEGGAGNDTYVIDVLVGLGGVINSASDIVWERAGEGFDSVGTYFFDLDLNFWTYIGFASSIERISLSGTLPLKASGNNFDNTLEGFNNSAPNVLTGRGGNDTYNVGYGDSIVETANGGTADTVISRYISLDLAYYANVENLGLLGAALLNARGNNGANILDGSQNTAGNMLTGLGGNDIYIVGAGDRVTEVAGVAGGTDSIRSATVSIALANFRNVENILLMGSLALSATGNAANNVINGSANTGANRLSGLGGNDTYYVGRGDTIVESGGTAGGIDAAVSGAVSINLLTLGGGSVERATLTGSLNLSLTGSKAANILTGNSGNNVLNGGAGADTMNGGLGNDVYHVDHLGDRITDTGGIETVIVSVGSQNTFYIMQAGIETLRMTGASRNATGNDGHNIIVGNAYHNIINGGGGFDVIQGGAGEDRLSGGAGNDKLFGDSRDDILDGGTGEDALFGGDGNDALLASKQQDMFWGGEGEDLFYFSKAFTPKQVPPGTNAGIPYYSPVTIVYDYKDGQDQIVLLGFGGSFGALDFRNALIFDPSLPSTPSYTPAVSVVMISYNGLDFAALDGNATVSNLTRSDFIL